MEYKLELEDFRLSRYKYNPNQGKLRPVQENNMWGYVDDGNNVLILDQSI